MATGDSGRAIRVATSKRNGSRYCSGRQQRAHQWLTIQRQTPPDRQASPSLPLLNRLPARSGRRKAMVDSRLDAPTVNEG